MAAKVQRCRECPRFLSDENRTGRCQRCHGRWMTRRNWMRGFRRAGKRGPGTKLAMRSRLLREDRFER